MKAKDGSDNMNVEEKVGKRNAAVQMEFYQVCAKTIEMSSSCWTRPCRLVRSCTRMQNTIKNYVSVFAARRVPEAVGWGAGESERVCTGVYV